MNPRLAKLKKLLAEKSLDAGLISSVPNIIYLTDFTHFSSEERDGYLLITIGRYRKELKPDCRINSIRQGLIPVLRGYFFSCLFIAKINISSKIFFSNCGSPYKGIPQ